MLPWMAGRLVKGVLPAMKPTIDVLRHDEVCRSKKKG